MSLAAFLLITKYTSIRKLVMPVDIGLATWMVPSEASANKYDIASGSMIDEERWGYSICCREGCVTWYRNRQRIWGDRQGYFNS